jgi:hypothetical protein
MELPGMTRNLQVSWLTDFMKGWGWACERVKAVDVVTAEGELLHCNENQNEDLYWAAQGAGPGKLLTHIINSSSNSRPILVAGFPGVITQFHLELIPYPKRGFRSSGYVYPISKYHEAFSWIVAITPGFDRDTEIAVVSMYPEDNNDICLFILLVTLKHTPEEAEAALTPAQ